MSGSGDGADWFAGRGDMLGAVASAGAVVAHDESVVVAARGDRGQRVGRRACIGSAAAQLSDKRGRRLDETVVRAIGDDRGERVGRRVEEAVTLTELR